MAVMTKVQVIELIEQHRQDLFERSVDVVTPESLSPFIGRRILDEVEYVSLSDRLAKDGWDTGLIDL